MKNGIEALEKEETRAPTLLTKDEAGALMQIIARAPLTWIEAQWVNELIKRLTDEKPGGARG